MHGNVWEFCRDIYAEKLPGGLDPFVKSDEKTKSSFRVIRGAGVGYEASGCRSAIRSWSETDDRYIDRGFRVALSAAVRSAQ